LENKILHLYVPGACFWFGLYFLRFVNSSNAVFFFCRGEDKKFLPHGQFVEASENLVLVFFHEGADCRRVPSREENGHWPKEA